MISRLSLPLTRPTTRTTPEFPFVVTDNYRAAREGVRYLVEQGAEHIVYLGDEARNVALDDRLAGARDEAEQSHLATKCKQGAA